MRRQAAQNGSEFTTAHAEYASAAVQASGGAPPVAGMAPYPLYGLPLGQTENESPFYLRPLPMLGIGFGLGLSLIGGIYAYIKWWRPMRKKMKANGLRTMKKKIAAMEKEEES